MSESGLKKKTYYFNISVFLWSFKKHSIRYIEKLQEYYKEFL